MYAITVREPGGPEMLEWAEVPDPVAGPGEVLIDVAASAVNRADLLQRQGHYPPPPGASEIIGLECSGQIAALGEGVTGWSVGDEVCALLAGGGYAREGRRAGRRRCCPCPTGVDLVTAGGLPEVACTVWSNVVAAGRLAAGETFLVQGGTQRHRHARDPGRRRRSARGSSPPRRRSGPTGAASWAPTSSSTTTTTSPSELKEATDGHGADVILDNMGAKGLAANVAALAADGRLLIIGMQGGTKAELNLNTLLRKRGSVIAMSLRGRPVAGRTARARSSRGSARRSGR